MATRMFGTGRNRRNSIQEPGTANGGGVPSNIATYVAQGAFVDSPQHMSRIGTGVTDPSPPNSATQHQPVFNVHARVEPVQNGPRKWSQQDQDAQDEQARQKALKELVGSWMDRLQLISVITTFFAAIESQLLGIVTPSDASDVSRVQRASVATLSSSLVVHVFAAILSFIAAFFLVRFRLHEASQQERKAEAQADHKATALETGGATSEKASTSNGTAIWSSNPQLEQVGPFRRGKPPTHLLETCHTLCMVFSVLGFVLAMVGVLCYAWAMLPVSSQILCTVSIGLCLIVSTVAIFLPQGYSLFAPSHAIDSSTPGQPPYSI